MALGCGGGITDISSMNIDMVFDSVSCLQLEQLRILENNYGSKTDAFCFHSNDLHDLDIQSVMNCHRNISRKMFFEIAGDSSQAILIH